mmetsp:Transcript_4749/g.13761  ORF Transcript_4749/g.13761 Transcript_4749/m.13761 type:complete len:265 (+) Transcript_4749:3743-4537(+)
MLTNGTRFENFHTRSAPAEPYCTIRSAFVSTSTWTLHSCSMALAMATMSIPAFHSCMRDSPPCSSMASLTNLLNRAEVARSTARAGGWKLSACTINGNSIVKSRPPSLSHWFVEASCNTNMRYFWQSAPVSDTMPSLTFPSTFLRGSLVEERHLLSEPAGPYCRTRSFSESTRALMAQAPSLSLARTATSTPLQLHAWCFAASSAANASLRRRRKIFAPRSLEKSTMKLLLPFFIHSLGLRWSTNWKPFTPEAVLTSTFTFLMP